MSCHTLHELQNLENSRFCGKRDLEFSKLPLSIRLFQCFEERIYSKGLKLSKIVHSSSAEILICNCVSMICDAAVAAANLM